MQQFSFLGLCWDTVDMSVSLSSGKLTEIRQLVHSIYKANPLQSIRLCPFWARPTFVPMFMSCTIYQFCYVIHSNMSTTLLLKYFFLSLGFFLFLGFWDSHLLLWHLVWFYVKGAYCLAKLQAFALILQKWSFIYQLRCSLTF